MKIPLSVFALVFAFGAEAGAFEYFVNKSGADDNDGRSRSQAFLSIQEGLAAMGAGDTLSIGPGEYRESLTRKNLGSLDKQTVIRAELPGTVILRGDEEVGPFRKTDGHQFVYQAPCAREVHAVTESDTLSGLKKMPNLAELDAAPGRWFYDQKKKMLYVSASDWNPAMEHHYLASVVANDGIFLESPKRVLIEGLAVTGFNNSLASWTPPSRADNAGLKVVWGLLLFQAQSCEIRDVTAYFNGGGIAVNNGQDPDPELRGRGNRVEDCVAYGNHSQINAYMAAGVGVYFPDNDEIRNCLTYNNDAFGTRFYGQIQSPSKLGDTLSWGNWGNMGDIQDKTGDREPGQGVRIENTISLGGFPNVLAASQSITGRDTFSKDNISLATVDGEPPLDQDREFADSINFDFRLQADSRFRDSGPTGKDRGPLPYQANIYYVASGGDDEADGLSMRHPWKTLAHALAIVRAGDTVYLGEGTYGVDSVIEIQGTEGKAVSFRARGRGLVTIEGPLEIKDGRNLDWQRINFGGPVRLLGGQDIRFDRCRFLGKSVGLTAQNVGGLEVTHSEFTGMTEAGIALDYADSAAASDQAATVPADVWLSGNIFDNTQGVAVRLEGADWVRYSDFNAFRIGRKSWMVNGEGQGLGAAGRANDHYSRELTPVYKRVNGLPLLSNSGSFAVGGPLGKPFGCYQDEMKKSQSRLVLPPFVHSVSATTANLEWRVSTPAACELIWGDTPKGKHRVVFEVNHWGSFSLTGLKPGQTYYFRLKSLSLPPALESEMQIESFDCESETIAFTTLSEDAPPATYYVAPDGDNANSGLSREKAFQTITRAAAVVNVGDTVRIAGGVYPERVRLHATGSPGKAITFQALPGEKVILDGSDGELNNAFILTGKDHLRFDGLYFSNFNIQPDQGWSLWLAAEFNIYQTRDVEITRCFSDGRSGYTALFVVALQAEDLLIKNCVMVNKFMGMALWMSCPNVRIENNVFAGTMVLHIVLGNRPGTKASIVNNIFTDNIPVKAFQNIPMFNIGPGMLIQNNCFYFRNFFRPDERTPLENGLTFSEARKTGRIVDSLFANPVFAGVATADPQFKPNYDMGYDLAHSPDRLMDAGLTLSFADFFATNPEVGKRKIGLIPSDFQSLLPKSAPQPK